jgi:hypothetical protein
MYRTVSPTNMRFCSQCGIGLGVSWLLLAACGGPALDPFARGSSLAGGAGDNQTTTGAVAGVGAAGVGAAGAVTAGSDGGSSSLAGAATVAGSAPGSAGGGAENTTGGALPASGGEAGADNGGGGGVVVDPNSACFGHTVVPKPLLADAEAGTKGFFAYVESQAATVSLVHPGAFGSAAAIDFHGGKAQSSGMGFGLFCDDVSSFAGVSFWAKGRGGEHLRFLVAIPATDATPGRGDCNPQQVKCNDHPGKALVLTSDWKQYTVTWGELEQYGWGEPATFAGIANSLLWINDGPVDSFDFVVDEVRLLSGSK